VVTGEPLCRWSSLWAIGTPVLAPQVALEPVGASAPTLLYANPLEECCERPSGCGGGEKRHVQVFAHFLMGRLWGSAKVKQGKTVSNCNVKTGFKQSEFPLMGNGRDD